MEFLSYTKELNKIVKNIDIREEILEEDIIKAIYYMNNMYLNDTGDFLIFLAALNLCNAYVKLDSSKISYTFKKGIEYIIDVLNYRDVDDIYVSVANDKGKLYIFQIGDIQFSFHDEKNLLINKKYLKELSFDGIKKQRCAKYIFESAINSSIRVTNQTYRGNDLNVSLKKTLDNYKLNKISLEDLLRFKL